jgi:heavy metal sensor kinase
MPAEEAQPAGVLNRAAHSLRARLTASYVLLFALVLTSIGLSFREALRVTVHQQQERLLDEEWTGLRGFLRVQDGELAWLYRPGEPEEAYAVEKLKRVLLLADARGEILEISPGYAAIGPETQAQIRAALESREPLTVRRTDSQGNAYLVRMGVVRDEEKSYVVALGYPLEDLLRLTDRLMRVYFFVMPVMLLAIAVLGWFAVDRALRPLMEVAAAVRAVSGGNLSLRIAARSTGDELDVLIKTFNSMMERLEANFERMRRFSVDASHELRTPLTGIRGQLEVALLTARTTEQYRSAIETAMEDVERLVGIVNGLLQLAEAESGHLRLQRSLQRLAPIVEARMERLSAQAGKKRIRMIFDGDQDCCANVDREQIARLLGQLLGNAVTYTRADGEVRVRAWAEGTGVKLRVSDNGPGIADEHLPHIFERFYRVRAGETGQGTGAGLGLTLAAWLVDAHQGQISVTSQQGHGTSFEVSLPAGGPPLSESA